MMMEALNGQKTATQAYALLN